MARWMQFKALMTSFGRRYAFLVCACTTIACAHTPPPVTGLRINELVSNNEGVAVDEAGETEDVIELINAGDERVWLDDYVLNDSSDEPATLPSVPLDPGQRIVLYADGETDEGERHLPFGISSGGERVELRAANGFLYETVQVPRLTENQTFARFPDGDGDFVACRYASPGRANGERCGPPTEPEVSVEPFAPYEWPAPHPWAPEGLRIVEASLREDAPFIELVNGGMAPITLARYSLRLASHAPHLPWPTDSQGVAIPLDGSLPPGARITIDVPAEALAEIGATEHFEGVVTLFDGSTLQDRLDFMAWPEGASLARYPNSDDRFVFCSPTRDAANEGCTLTPSREVPGRLRYLRTPSDFDALAAGGTTLGLKAVKVVVDLERGNAVHLISAAAYALHYTFVREEIYREPSLDRCDPVEAATFRAAWGRYSREQYTEIDGRRFLQGTLVHHAGPDLRTLDFVTGDRIVAEQMQHAFFTVVPHLEDPSLWYLRPQGTRQAVELRSIEGNAPILAENAVRAGITFQPLNAAVSFGVLRFVASHEVEEEPLGHDVILLTDDVPNDLPLVGGVITEAPQTPLAHINVLSRGRGTPNMALRDARTNERVAPLLGELVRFEVTEADFLLRRATREEAEAFWDEQRPTGPRISPRLDPSVNSLVILDGAGLADIPAIGAKAAQLGELSRVVSRRRSCPGPIETPAHAFAVPVHFYLQHFTQSGAQSYLEEAMARDDFAVDIRVRAEVLAEVRRRMMETPVNAETLTLIEDAVRDRWGEDRVRFRSSSNVEDLSDFSGAGLYTSQSAEIGDDDRRVEDALRVVWSSLWNHRAFEERERGHIDQRAVAMGVLVHAAFRSELANGIGISRNVLDLTRNDIYYFNVQVGEAGVANPAPGVRTDEYLYRFGRNPRIVYEQRSSLTPFDILHEEEQDQAACILRAIHDAFRPLLDPEQENPYFAMDIEWKLVGSDRRIVVKQARPYDVGEAEVPTDCRGF